MTREQAPIAHPVQPAPEPVAWHGGGNLYWIPENAPRGLTLNPLYDGPWVQPAGDALPPIAAAQKPDSARVGRSPVVPGDLITSDAAASEPAGDVAWLPDWIQSLRADTGHFVSAEAAADLAEQVRRKFAEAQPVCELTRLRGVLLEIVREDAEGRGYFAAIALKALRADTQPAGDVRPTSFSTEEVMVLTDYLTERTAKALQRPAGEDRADALRDALTGLLDHCADQGWWMEVHAVKVMDNARAVLAETQRPAPDKPAPGSTQ